MTPDNENKKSASNLTMKPAQSEIMHRKYNSVNIDKHHV
jgi:hypothetical protein